MSAPVNPEGQTAREHEQEKAAVQKEGAVHAALHELVQAIYWSGAEPLRTVSVAAAERFHKAVCAAKFALEKPATPISARPSEGQTAQEVRHRAEALWIALNQPAMTSNKGIDLIVRALASTPSPAKQTEQKIASAEGTASQLGAAPATRIDPLTGRPRRYLGPLDDGPMFPRDMPDEALRAIAEAQPDARDAEIARLNRDLSEYMAWASSEFAGRAWQPGETYDAWRARLAALAPPEPKAETPAETAGQKEGR